MEEFIDKEVYGFLGNTGLVGNNGILKYSKQSSMVLILEDFLDFPIPLEIYDA